MIKNYKIYIKNGCIEQIKKNLKRWNETILQMKSITSENKLF